MMIMMIYKDKHPCRKIDSNPLSHRPSDQGLTSQTARPACVL